MITQESVKAYGQYCKKSESDLSDVITIKIQPETKLKDYLEATQLAKEEALKHMDDYMLMSWYDRDRDFESPQHATESDDPSGTPGYVYYGINHGARLKVDIEDGRFVFFFTPVEF